MTCCPLSEFDGYNDFYSDKIVTARKQHKCCECHGFISEKSKYHYAVGSSSDGFFTFKTCLICHELRQHFSCNRGWVFETLWEDLNDNFIPNMKAGGPCMEGLSSGAKAVLFQKWNKWKFEENV